jgi:hypothetical protein
VLLILAIGLALICVPVFAAAANASEHCVPAAPRAADHDCCPSADAMDCCVSPEDNPAVPMQSEAQNTRVGAGFILLDAHGAPVGTHAGRPAFCGRHRLAPVHGYRTTDLPTLHSAFLI